MSSLLCKAFCIVVMETLQCFSTYSTNNVATTGVYADLLKGGSLCDYAQNTPTFISILIQYWNSKLAHSIWKGDSPTTATTEDHGKQISRHCSCPLAIMPNQLLPHFLWLLNLCMISTPEQALYVLLTEFLHASFKSSDVSLQSFDLDSKQTSSGDFPSLSIDAMISCPSLCFNK